MWLVYAILSAVFAALTTIFAKIGIKDVNSHLATALRTGIVLLPAWGMVFLSGAQKGIGKISGTSWLFIVLSGLATGISWLAYYRALQLGKVSQVAPIDKLSIALVLIFSFVVLKEPFDLKAAVGSILICAGAIVMAL